MFRSQTFDWAKSAICCVYDSMYMLVVSSGLVLAMSSDAP